MVGSSAREGRPRNPPSCRLSAFYHHLFHFNQSEQHAGYTTVRQDYFSLWTRHLTSYLYRVASTSKPHDPTPPKPTETDAPPADDNLDEDDDDGLLEELEEELDNDFDLGGFRERRMEELRAQ